MTTSIQEAYKKALIEKAHNAVSDARSDYKIGLAEEDTEEDTKGEKESD